MKYETGLLDDWLEESKAAGKLETMRKMLTLLLTRRFTTLPEKLLKKIGEAKFEWCENLFNRSIMIGSLEELEWEK